MSSLPIIVTNVFIFMKSHQMKKKWYQSIGLWYWIWFVIALGIIFGLGKTFNEETKKTTTTFTPNGITQFRKGMDIAGWVKLTYKVDFSKYNQIYTIQTERELAKRQAIAVILKNIDNRISALWVSDYSARQQNIGEDTFLVIEIGGVHSIDSAKEIIGKTVELEFKVPATKEDKANLTTERKKMTDDLFAQIKSDPSKFAELTENKEGNDIFYTDIQERDLDTLSSLYSNKKEIFATAKKGDLITSEWIYIPASSPEESAIEWYSMVLVDSVTMTPQDSVSLEKLSAVAIQFDKQMGISTGTTHEGTTGTLSYDSATKELRLNSDLNASSFGNDSGFQVLAIYGVWADEQGAIEKALKNSLIITGKEVFINKAPQWIVAVNTKTNEILNGAFFSYSAPSVNQFWKPVITINFNDKGKEIFCNLTKELVWQQMAIFVGGKLQTAPVINEAICWGSAQIDGQFTTDSAKELSDSLNEGALPAPLIISQEEKVSPVLGDGAINGAFLAGWMGLVLMFIFLLFSYSVRTAVIGMVVMVAFLVYSLAVFKVIDYAFSLSGIAAIILSLGMGIDANIIIYERLREELNTGKSRSAAVDAAYERSRLAIRDGNVTNIIVYVVLFGMGMSIFKGFWFAGLITGILILIVNVPLTKVLLNLFKK